MLSMTITEFPVPSGGSGLLGITPGPDGNVWFAEGNANKIGRINPSTGAITEFALPTPNDRAGFLTYGPAGNHDIWFTETNANKIGELDPATGLFTEFPIPTANSNPSNITPGPDGNIWFAEYNTNQIGMLDPATGKITEFPVESQSPSAELYGITAGPDGDIWFTEVGSGQIGKIDPATDAVTVYPPVASGGQPYFITAGPDGNLWFTEAGNNWVGAINPATGAVSEYAIPSPMSLANDISAGPDGSIWFVEQATNKLAQINPDTKQITEYSIPTSKSAPIGITTGPDGNLWFTEDGANQLARVNLGLTQTAPSAPVLATADDTGISNTDGVTRNNGSTSAPLDFSVTGVSPANGFVTLYDNGQVLAGPIQATGGTAFFHIAASPLADGTYAITATQSATANGTQSHASAAFSLSIQRSLTITGTNPADGAYVPELPNGQVVVTFSHPLAGLKDGDSPIQNEFPFNPYDVFLLARGPDGVFSAPSGMDQGDLPLHANVVYHVNADGTSEFVITPTEPLASDVYALSVDLAAFSDLAGNPLTDAHSPAGYRTFLVQAPPVSNQPLEVTGVTEYNGYATISGTAAQPASIYQPDTIAIHFNKPLFAGAAGNGNVKLLDQATDQNLNAIAAYNPTTDTIDLTPTGPLNVGTVYEIWVSGAVSDDQGFGQSDANGLLGQPFTDDFTVKNRPVVSDQTPFAVASDAHGVPRILPVPASSASSGAWTLPVGYVSVQFNATLAFWASAVGRYSVMLVPRSGGLNNASFDVADVPLNATLAFNPNTNQLIIVPSQPVGNDVYLLSLSSLTSVNGNALVNQAGQAAGTSGAPYFATFGLSVAGAASPAVIVSVRAAPETTGATVPVPMALAAVPQHNSVAPAHVRLRTRAVALRSRIPIPTGPLERREAHALVRRFQSSHA